MRIFRSCLSLFLITTITTNLTGCFHFDFPIKEGQSEIKATEAPISESAESLNLDLPELDTHLNTLDTDGDSYPDKLEQYLGLDYTTANVYTEDNALNLSIEGEGVFLDLVGTPNIATVSVDEVDSIGIRNNAYMLSPVYEFYIDDFSSNIYNAEITIEFDDTDLTETERENVIIYQYCDDGSSIPVDNCKVEGNKVSAVLPHFSKYFAAPNSLTTWEGYDKTAIYFCIDDSGSMYNPTILEKQFKVDINDEDEATMGHDPYGLRWELVKQILQEPKINTDVIDIGICSYTMTPNELLKLRSEVPVTVAADTIDKFTLIDRSLEYLIQGTSLLTVIEHSIAQLDKCEAGAKYLFVVTDENVNEELDKVKSILAEHKDIIPIFVCTNGYSYELEDLVESLGYGAIMKLAKANFNSVVSSTLRLLTIPEYETITYTLYDNLGNARQCTSTVDVIVDSGYRVEQDGFMFKNFSTWNEEEQKFSGGTCFGISEVSMRYYMDRIDPNIFMSKKNTADNYIYLPGTHLIEPTPVEYLPPASLNTSGYYGPLFFCLTNNMHSLSDEVLEQLVAEDFLKVETHDFTGEDLKYLVLNTEKVPFISEICLPNRWYKLYDRQVSDVHISGYTFTLVEVDKFNKFIASDTFKNIEDPLYKQDLAMLYFMIQLYESQIIDPFNYREIGYTQYYYSDTYINDSAGDAFLDFVNAAQYVGQGHNLYEKDIMICKLIEELSQGRPANVGIDFKKLGGHSIVGGRLLRDVNDPNKLFIECYDCNKPGVPEYVIIDYYNLVGFMADKESGMPLVQSIAYTDYEDPIINLSVSVIDNELAICNAENISERYS